MRGVPFRALTGQLLLGWGIFNLWKGRSIITSSASTTCATFPRTSRLRLDLPVGGVGMIVVGWLMSPARRDPLLRW